MTDFSETLYHPSIEIRLKSQKPHDAGASNKSIIKTNKPDCHCARRCAAIAVIALAAITAVGLAFIFCPPLGAALAVKIGILISAHGISGIALKITTCVSGLLILYPTYRYIKINNFLKEYAACEPNVFNTPKDEAEAWEAYVKGNRTLRTQTMASSDLTKVFIPLVIEESV